VKYALALQPGVIPRDTTIGVRLQRRPIAPAAASVAAATTPAPAPITSACPPCDFILANFDGAAGTTVLDYAPDIGAKFLATDANADDGIFFPKENASLLVLDGAGGLVLDASVASQTPYRQFALKLGTAPVCADYYVEAGILKQPSDVLVGMMAARAKPMAGGWDNAIQSVGMIFNNHSFDDPGYLQIDQQTAIDGGSGGGVVMYDDDNYQGPNLYGFIYRFELKGMATTFKLNGVTVGTGTIDDARLADPGNIYLFFDFVRRDDLGYTSPVITHVRAGYLPGNNA
jgi:hypothetical protein